MRGYLIKFILKDNRIRFSMIEMRVNSRPIESRSKLKNQIKVKLVLKYECKTACA